MTRDLAESYAVARDLLGTLRAFQELCCALHLGMSPRDPRIEDVTRFRARLRDGLDRAREVLTPRLSEFACVHEWPIEINEFTASSAHQAIVKYAEWVYAQKWRTASLREFFEQYYDEERGRIDWDRVIADEVDTNEGMHEFRMRYEWAEHEALLEMEYAKASKLAIAPNSDVPKMVDIERNIVQALGDQTLTGREIAAKAGYPYNSNLRTRLARMVQRQLLEKVEPQGYRRRGVIQVG